MTRDPLDRLALQLISIGSSYAFGRRSLDESVHAVKLLIKPIAKKPRRPVAASEVEACRRSVLKTLHNAHCYRRSSGRRVARAFAGGRKTRTVSTRSSCTC